MVRDVINDSVISIIDEEFLEIYKSGDASKVKEAILSGTNINAKDNQSRTALIWASTKGHTKIVKLLLIKAQMSMLGTKMGQQR